MQSTEDQWTSSSSDDIVSKFWDNIADAKKAIKTWILDRHESWPPLIITTGSAFNSIAALRVATSISESQRGGMGSSALLHTLPITVLLQHIVDLMSGTPRGISQAELNET
jgi:hypothetical protein